MAADSTAAENQGRAASTTRCECPRCGYDVSGVISTWKESCPVRGRCSECGLEFEWSEMFGTGREPPRWLVESRRGWFIDRFGRTTVASLRPASFWTRVRLWHEVHSRRLFLWGITWAAAGYSVVALVSAFLHAWHVGLWSRGPRDWSEIIREFLLSLAIPWRGYATGYQGGVLGPAHWLVLAIAWWALSILAFMPLSESMQLARVRRAHVLRIWAYSLGGVVLIASLAYFARLPVSAGWTLSRFSAANGRGGYTTNPELDRFLMQGWWLPWAVGAWLWVFWYSATRRYLQLRHPRGVATATVVIGFLAGMLIVKLVSPESLREEIESFFARHVRWWSRWV